MDAGLIQLPAIIASVVGVRDAKTPSCWRSGCATAQVGSLFETGFRVQKQSFKPSSFWHHTLPLLSLSLSLSSCIQLSVAVEAQEARSSACT